MTPRGGCKEVRPFLKAARKAPRFDVRSGNGGHDLIVTPTGKRIHVPSSPGSAAAIRTLRARLRREGLNV